MTSEEETAAKVLEEVKSVQIELDEALNNKNRPRILLVGTTGSGKTTLLHALARIPLRATDNDDDYLLEPVESIAEVSNSTGSVTQIPNIVPTDTVTFCDCPGLCDTNPYQGIINAFVIDQLFNGGCQIGILIVVQASEFDVGKGANIEPVLKAVERLIPDFSQLCSCVGIILTRMYSPYKTMGKIGKELTRDGHSKLLDHFKDHPEAVFCFPAPVEPGKYDLFTDLDKICDFFSTHLCKNPEHCISIDDNSKEPLSKVTDSYNRSLVPAINAFKDEMKSIFQKESNEDKLKKWKESVESLIGRNDIGSFAEKVNKQSLFSGFKSLSVFKGMVKWQHFLSEAKVDVSLHYERVEIDAIFRGIIEDIDKLIEKSQFWGQVGEKCVDALKVGGAVGLGEGVILYACGGDVEKWKAANKKLVRAAVAVAEAQGQLATKSALQLAQEVYDGKWGSTWEESKTMLQMRGISGMAVQPLFEKICQQKGEQEKIHGGKLK